jgi:hypothetical protein
MFFILLGVVAAVLYVTLNPKHDIFLATSILAFSVACGVRMWKMRHPKHSLPQDYTVNNAGKLRGEREFELVSKTQRLIPRQLRAANQISVLGRVSRFGPSVSFWKNEFKIAPVPVSTMG